MSTATPLTAPRTTASGPASRQSSTRRRGAEVIGLDAARPTRRRSGVATRASRSSTAPAPAPTADVRQTPRPALVTPGSPSPQSTPPQPAKQNTSAREARGFVLYVGLDEAKAALDGTTLTKLVETLKRVTGEVAPHAETYAAVALAPKGTGGRDIDVVRLALGEPQALAEYYGTTPEESQPTGVTIDTTRRRVLLGGENVGLTYKEFELLQALVLREGRTVDRAEIIDTLWRDAPDERPNDRTIDVHVRRLRSKLGPYADIVRTVRGTGYRFDRHADVEVLYAMAHSPDRF